MWKDIRNPLTPGTRIPMQNGAIYTIGDVIGRGGLSLVYAATTKGGTMQSVIKEFYPAPGKSNQIYAQRNAEGRVCCIEGYQAQFAAAKALFESEAIIGGDAANITAQVLSFWEYHDGYAVMKRESADMRSLKTLVHDWEAEGGLLSPNGKKADTVSDYKDITRVNYALAIIDSTLAAVCAIHEKYLHLDLSSSNVIWACREPATGRNGFAVISDFGSAASLDEDGKFRPNYNLFSSKGFAAPEVYRRNCELDRKTDLFSVGMLLIYLCIGEDAFTRDFACVESKPSRWLKRDIGNIDLNIPRLFPEKLYEILLNALVERKYETAQEMQKDIRQLYDSTRIYIAEQETSLVSVGQKIQGVPGDAHYVSRKEIKGILARLQCNVNPIITGIGGIGKTTLARRFAMEYGGGRPYFVSFISFVGSFRKTIASLGNYDSNDREKEQKSLDDQFAEGLALLKSCSSNYVLIIDNVDTKTDFRSDPDFHYLQKMKMHFIFTTRNEMGREDIETVHLDRMDEDSCLELMKSYLGDYRNKEHDDTLKAIIAQINAHTLTCELLAKTLRDGFGLTPEDVLASLRDSKLDDERWCEIQSAYNLDYIPRTVLAHLRTAFNLSALSDEMKRILSSFCLAEYGLTKQYIEHLFSVDEWKIIREARNRGWLMCRNESIEWDDYPTKECEEPIHRSDSKIVYILHPVIRAVCLLDQNTQPMWKRNKSFIREFAIIDFFQSCDPAWDRNHKKSEQIFQNVEKMKDFFEIEHEDPECACLLYLHLLKQYRFLFQIKYKIDPAILRQYQQGLVRVCRLLDHNSGLFYIALYHIAQELAAPSHYQKLYIHMYLSYMRLNIDSVQNSAYVEKFLKHMASRNYGHRLLNCADNGQVYLLLKDYSQAYCESSTGFWPSNVYKTLIESEEIYESTAPHMWRGLTAELVFERAQVLIISALHTDKTEEALSFAKFTVYDIEAHGYIQPWSLNPCVHTVTKHTQIQSEWKSGKIAMRYQSWFRSEYYRSCIRENEAREDQEWLIFVHPKECLLNLILMCETAYHVAMKANQKSLATEFKEKYSYYLFLLKSHYSDRIRGAANRRSPFSAD